MTDMPALLVQLDQRTPQWHAWRLEHRMSTESIPLLGVAEKWMPVRTPLALYNAKVLDIEGERSAWLDAAAARGNRLEPRAIALVEERIGVPFSPCTIARGDYGASLDGGDFGFVVDDEPLHMEQTAEVKSPVGGFESKRGQSVIDGTLLTHDEVQVQHQLMVSGARVCHFAVYDETLDDVRQLEVTPDTTMHGRIREAWDAFWPHMTQREPPPPGEGDVIERDDDDWVNAVARYRQASLDLKAAKATEAAARAALVEMCGPVSSEGSGYRVTRFWKKASLSYSTLKEVKALDLEHHRGPRTLETRITESKA